MRSKSLNPYARLARLHQPVGIWLLFWPCTWTITLASNSLPNPLLLLLFFIGAVVMRSAGCIINDVWDRKLDATVARTRTRPLASGELSVHSALIFMGILLVCALGVALLLGQAVLLWAAASLPLVVLYPLMKRITWWPQLFLGLTFNWGALLGSVAVSGDISVGALWFYAAGVFWTLGYDTIYAHQDRTEDEKAGMKSTARLWGEHSRPLISICYLLSMTCVAIALHQMHGDFSNLLLMLPAAIHLLWQLWAFRPTQPVLWQEIFTSNAWAGGLCFAGLLGIQVLK